MRAKPFHHLENESELAENHLGYRASPGESQRCKKESDPCACIMRICLIGSTTERGSGFCGGRALEDRLGEEEDKGEGWLVMEC